MYRKNKQLTPLVSIHVVLSISCCHPAFLATSSSSGPHNMMKMGEDSAPIEFNHPTKLGEMGEREQPGTRVPAEQGGKSIVLICCQLSYLEWKLRE